MLRTFAVLYILVFPTGCMPAMPDDPPAEPPPAPTTPVTLRVLDGGAPAPGVTVIFQAPDDTDLLEVATGPDGTASAIVPDGGSVSVIRGPSMVTYTGVVPGDVLELARPRGLDTMAVTVTLALPPVGTYAVTTPCGGGTGAGELVLVLTGCGSETDFFGVDIADPDGASFLVHAAIAPSIDLSLATVRGDLDTQLVATNAPADAPVALSKRLVVHGAELYRSTEVPLQTPTRVPAIDSADAVQLVVARAGAQVIAARAPYTNDTGIVDLAMPPIPAPSTPTYDGTTVAWTETGAGTADIVVATIAGTQTTRAIAGAHAGATLHVPRLPFVHDWYNIEPGAPVTVAIAHVDGGYPAARAHALDGSLLAAAPLGTQIVAAATSGEP